MHCQNSKSCKFTTISFVFNKSALILTIFLIGSALAFLIQAENFVKEGRILNLNVEKNQRLLIEANLENESSNFERNAENERFGKTNEFSRSATQEHFPSEITPEAGEASKQTNLRSVDLLYSISPPTLPENIIANLISSTNQNQIPSLDTSRETISGISQSEENPTTNVFDLPQESFKPTLIGGISEEQKNIWIQYTDLRNQPLWSPLAQEEKHYYSEKYNIEEYDELPFCIFVPSFNNVEESRYINNLNSIFQQEYSNYYVVFIDDASTDGTGKLVEEYARKHRISKEKLRIFINEERKMAMPNIYRAATELCQPDDLFMIVDGDDQLLGKQVLKLFNAAFQKEKSWIVYSNFLSLEGEIGYSRPYASSVIQSNSYRHEPFFISHLRVFYTKLFSLIRESDLKDDEGNWFRAANDVAMYFPMMEMSYKRITYLPELCYMYNSNTGLNNHHVKQEEQTSNDAYIRTKSNYPFLEQLFSETEIINQSYKRGRQIAIKDYRLPIFESVEVFGWEL